MLYAGAWGPRRPGQLTKMAALLTVLKRFISHQGMNFEELRNTSILARFRKANPSLSAIVSRNQVDMEVKLYGFHSNEFTNCGLSDLPDLVEMFAAARQAGWKAGHLDMEEKLRQEGHTFILGQRYLFYEGLPASSVDFQKNGSKTITTNDLSYKLICSSIGHVGDTSLETITILADAEQKLIQCETFWIFVDKGSRRKTKLPLWFTKKYKSNVEKFKDLSLQDQDIEMDTYEITRKVLHTDIDHFGHTNHVCYMSVGVECLMKLYEELKLRRPQLDYHLMPLSKAEILFKGESRLNDLLIVKAGIASNDRSRAFANVTLAGRLLAHMNFISCGSRPSSFIKKQTSNL